MKKQLLLFFITILSLCYNYSQTLDVDFTGTCGASFELNENQTFAQSFTAGLTGNLVQVNAGLSVRACTETSIMNLIAKIYDGTCAGTVIATQSFSLPVDSFLSVSMREIVFDTPASVVSGQTYTLELSVPSGQVCDGIQNVRASWHLENSFNCGGSYSGGTAYRTGCSEYPGDYYVQTFVETPPENALNFDGNNDYVSSNNSLLPFGNNSRTIEAWFKVGSSSSARTIVNYGNQSTNQRFGVLILPSGTLYIVGEFNDFDTGVTVDDNLWHHVAVTFDGTNLIVYLDGNNIASTTKSYNTSGSLLGIGSSFRTSSWGEFYNGDIDEVRIWNTTRTEQQINDFKDIKLEGTETGLVTYYNFNQGIAGGDNTGETSLIDQTSNGNNGILNNFTLKGSTSNWVNGALDTTSPTVTSVTVPANATYVASQNLDFTVNFDENVTVNTTGGTPQIAITIGSTTRQASYISGSGSAALLFRYIVQCDEDDTDGIAIGTLTTNGGTIQDKAKNDADLTLNSVGNTANILINGSITGTAIANSNVSCNGGSDGSATASATGGTTPYTYLWSNSATTATTTVLTAGTYNVTITDANGCEYTASVTITEPVALVASATADSNVSCNDGSDGSATASVTGGTAPYTYLWSNSTTTATITGVTAGTYDVTITDANGCTDTASVTITEPVALVASAIANNNVSCNGGSDGSATASATGGTAPYTYLWSNSATTASITGVTAGTYDVTITDANGCTDTASVTITEPVAIDTSVTTDNSPTFTANASGATYQWINCDIDQPIIGETGQSFTATENGSYAVDITINGCTERSACIEVNSLSISDNSNDPTFSIYPNPTSDLITITVPVNKVVIYNLAGKKVKEEISRTFSVKELPAGVYFLNIESEEGIAIRKLVKH